MKEQDVSELCRQVNQVVKQAVEYAQSPQFQDTIQQGVQKTVNGVKKTVGNFTAGMRQQPPYQPPNFYPGGNYRQRVKPHVRPTVRPPIYPNYNTPPVYPQTGRPQVVAKSAKTGPSKGTGLFVLGGICTFVFFVILATMLGDFLISPISMLEDLSVFCGWRQVQRKVPAREPILGNSSGSHHLSGSGTGVRNQPVKRICY